MTKKIKLMTDYNYYPIWDTDEPGDLDPDDLPLSSETIKQLLQWQKTYDNIINWDDPQATGFASPEAELDFEKTGINLWLKLQTELSPEYEVVYFCRILGRIVTNLDEVKHILNLNAAVAA